MTYTGITLSSEDICNALAALSMAEKMCGECQDLKKSFSKAYDNLILERDMAIRREGETCEVKSLAEY